MMKKNKPINMATGGLMNMPPFIKKSEEEKEKGWKVIPVHVFIHIAQQQTASVSLALKVNQKVLGSQIASLDLQPLSLAASICRCSTEGTDKAS